MIYIESYSWMRRYFWITVDSQGVVDGFSCRINFEMIYRYINISFNQCRITSARCPRDTPLSVDIVLLPFFDSSF